MNKKYRIFQVDAFTRKKFRGNPAGVVMDADGLSEREMQSIARELNNSETAFLLPAEGPDHEFRIRYFTPTVEVPICGHATVAAHYVRAKMQEQSDRSLRFKTGIGVLSADLMKEGADWRIRFTQGDPTFGKVITQKERAELLKAFQLLESDMVTGLPIQIVSTGHSKVMIPLVAKKKLDGLKPDLPALTKLSAALGCNGFYTFTLDSQDPTVFAHGRMFAPAIGIAEDPVTGNASGPLGAFLVKYHRIPVISGEVSFRVRQGEAIGREGEVDVQVTVRGQDEPVKVMISGMAVIVFEAEIQIEA